MIIDDRHAIDIANGGGFFLDQIDLPQCVGSRSLEAVLPLSSASEEIPIRRGDGGLTRLSCDRSLPDTVSLTTEPPLQPNSAAPVAAWV
jgi:hypothetical protein